MVISIKHINKNQKLTSNLTCSQNQRMENSSQVRPLRTTQLNVMFTSQNQSQRKKLKLKSSKKRKNKAQ